MVPDTDADEGIDNYSEKLRPVSARTNSAASFQTEGGVSMKEMQGFINTNSTTSTTDDHFPRKGTPVLHNKNKTQFIQNVPQTDV